MCRCLVVVHLFPIAVATSMPALARKGMRLARTLADRQAHRKNRDGKRILGRSELENEKAAATGWGVGLVPAKFVLERRHIARAWADTARTTCTCNEPAARATARPFRCSASLPHDRWRQRSVPTRGETAEGSCRFAMGHGEPGDP